MSEPITWITKNGKHIPIYADKPTEDEQKKDKEISQSRNEANKKSGDRLDCGADPKALRQEMREKLLDKDSYMLTEEYQKLDDEVMKYWDEYNKLSDRRRELYKIQEENTTPDNSMKIGSNDYESRVIAKMFGTKNDKAKAAEAELKVVREKMNEADSKHEAAVQKLKEYEKKHGGNKAVDEHTVSKNIKSSYTGFQLDTGTSHYQDLLKKGKAYIVEMSPKTYLQYCGSKIFDSTYEKQVRACIADAAHTYALADEMKRGTKMYMPMLNFKEREQEGRHRAVAAMLNSIDKIPVLIVR